MTGIIDLRAAQDVRKCSTEGSTIALSLGDRVEAAAAALFQGRERELERNADLLADRAALPRLVALTGPPGIGKTTLLREAVRRVGATGVGAAVVVDVREFDRTPEGLERVLSKRVAGWPGAQGSAPLLLGIDGYHLLQLPEIRAMRERYLQHVSEPILIVLAQRRPPIDLLSQWAAWRPLLEVMPLGALSAAEAGRFLDRQGVDDPARAMALRFAEGNPLALSLAGELARSGGLQGWRLQSELAAVMRARLFAEVGSADLIDLVEVASLREGVNEEILAALAGRDVAAQFHAFLRVSVVDHRPGGGGVAPPWNRILADDLRRRRPAFARDAVRRGAAVAEACDNATSDGAGTIATRAHYSGSASLNIHSLGVRGAMVSDHAAVREHAMRHAALMPAQDSGDFLELIDAVIGLAPRILRVAGDPAIGFHAVVPLVAAHMSDSSAEPRGESGEADMPLVAGVVVARSGDEAVRHALLLDIATGAVADSVVVATPDAKAGWQARKIDVALGWRGHAFPELQITETVIDLNGQTPYLRKMLLEELNKIARRERLPNRATIDEVKRALQGLHDPKALTTSELACLPRVRALGGDPGESLARLLASLIAWLSASSDHRDAEAGRVLHAHYVRRGASHETVAEQLGLSRATLFRRHTSGLAAIALQLTEGPHPTPV